MNTLDSYFIIPLREMLSTVLSFVPTVVSVFIILFLGYMLTKLLHGVLAHLFKMMRLDKMMDKLELSKLFHVGKVKYSASHLLIALLGLIVTFMFVIVAMRIVGLDSLSELMGDIIAYVAPVVTAVFILVVGMVVAKIASLLVHAVVAIFGLPNPKLHERISRWAILLYAIKLSLVELGFGYLFTGSVFHIWFSGLVLALALAFGLGGKEAAARMLNKK